MSELKFENISASYGKKRVLENFSLTVTQGKILCLVGPSGCGKTTLVRCLLGLTKPESGRISIGDTVLFDSKKRINIPAEKRNIGIVFQDYAVWPHMTVIENVMYPLKKRRVDKRECKERAMRALSQVNMSNYASYLPSQLSGGQQQRVAIARALVVDSQILVMDEPITNLDAKLREQMLLEIRMIQKRLGSTILYITHDQQSALQLCDQMAIMQDDGKLCQLDDDENIILNPANRFVFEFIGTSNFIPVHIENKRIYLECGQNIEYKLPSDFAGEVEDGKKDLGIRLNDVIFDPSSDIKAKVISRVFLGSEYNYFLRLGDKEIRVQQSMLDAKLGTIPDIGEEVGVNFVNPRFYQRKGE